MPFFRLSPCCDRRSQLTRGAFSFPIPQVCVGIPIKVQEGVGVSQRQGRLGWVSVIGKTSRRSSRPRSRIACRMARAREARPETPIGLQPLEAPLIAGWEVLFSSTEYVHTARAIREPVCVARAGV